MIQVNSKENYHFEQQIPERFILLFQSGFHNLSSLKQFNLPEIKMRKYFTLVTILLSILLINNVYSWGDKGHRLIAEKSFDFLPEEMNKFLQLNDEIIKHCIDPDYRKEKDRTEGPKHYIDIDFYPHFLEGRVIATLDSTIAVYGDSAVYEMGYLPWATYNTYQKLINAFKAGYRDSIILYASDLAHYVGDGFQPLHACLNYDGQLTNQKGLHSRYEIKMVDRYLEELRAEKLSANAVILNNIQRRIFDYIAGSNIYAPLIQNADKFSTDSGFYYNEDKFFQLLWFRTRYVTIQQMNSSALELASLYYTAWVNAGKPDLTNL